MTHKAQGIERNEDGSYTGGCRCGFTTTGPNREQEPDIEVRKDVMYKALAQHFVPLVPPPQACRCGATGAHRQTTGCTPLLPPSSVINTSHPS